MVEPFLFARFSVVILIFSNQSLTDPVASNILTGFSERTSLYICYWPASRPVLGKTVSEVLSKARGRRSRAALRTVGPFLFARFSVLSFNISNQSLTAPVAFIFSPGFREERQYVGIFSTRLALSVGSWFCFFFLIRKIYAGYVNVATGKSQTGRVKFYRFKGKVTSECEFFLSLIKKFILSKLITEGSASKVHANPRN